MSQSEPLFFAYNVWVISPAILLLSCLSQVFCRSDAKLTNTVCLLVFNLHFFSFAFSASFWMILPEFSSSSLIHSSAVDSMLLNTYITLIILVFAFLGSRLGISYFFL
jgi:hypothetical protein